MTKYPDRLPHPWPAWAIILASFALWLLISFVVACAPVLPDAMRRDLDACTAGRLRPVYECWVVRGPRDFDYRAPPAHGYGLGEPG